MVGGRGGESGGEGSQGGLFLGSALGVVAVGVFEGEGHSRVGVAFLWLFLSVPLRMCVCRCLGGSDWGISLEWLQGLCGRLLPSLPSRPSLSVSRLRSFPSVGVLGPRRRSFGGRQRAREKERRRGLSA